MSDAPGGQNSSAVRRGSPSTLKDCCGDKVGPIHTLPAL